MTILGIFLAVLTLLAFGGAVQWILSMLEDRQRKHDDN